MRKRATVPSERPLSTFLHQIPVESVLAKKRWNRDDWIVFALDVLEKEGLAGVRIEELARRSQRTPGSFYAHFKTRDELLEAILEAWLDFKIERAMCLDSQLFHAGEFTLEHLATRVIEGKVMYRMNLELAIRNWALKDERARRTVMQLDTQRLHNGTAMLTAEFPRGAHPQVFAMIFQWLNYGRSLAVVDPDERELVDSAALVLAAFVQMYQSTAATFKVRGGPRLKSNFEPLPQAVLQALDPVSTRPVAPAPIPVRRGINRAALKRRRR